METKTVDSAIIRLNNGNSIIIEQNKNRQRLDKLHNKFYKNVIEKLKIAEKR